AMIEKTDKTRASYYRYYTNQKWGAAKNYHLTLDSDCIGLDGTVDIIEHYLKVCGIGKESVFNE
ncbi:MAG: cytidylate kinase family protein, partial [Pygmaiobacter sp.]|nr:cytidylate kinase family protein [Pygmaiobacter sp.]